GGDAPLLVSEAGKDVTPVEHSKTFIATAETYDIIITVPQEGKVELRAMVQDGYGITTAYLGEGEILPAEIIAKPDKTEIKQEMEQMDMKMGAHALKYRTKKDERYKMKEKYGMKMDGMETNHSKMDYSMMGMKTDSIESLEEMKMDHTKMPHSEMEGMN